MMDVEYSADEIRKLRREDGEEQAFAGSDDFSTKPGSWENIKTVMVASIRRHWTPR